MINGCIPGPRVSDIIISAGILLTGGESIVKNSEVYRMANILIPMFLIISHILGLGFMIHPTWLAIIAGIVDITASSILLGMIISINFMKGSIVWFKRTAAVIAGILMLVEVFVLHVSTVGMMSTILCSLLYAAVWWSTEGGYDCNEPAEPMDWVDFMRSHRW